MQFTSVSGILALAALLEVGSSFVVSNSTAPKVWTRDVHKPTFSCSGSSECGSFPGLSNYCNEAMNALVDNFHYKSNAPFAADTGECRGDAFGDGCGVFIQGPAGCERTGKQMRAEYDAIRAHGCNICGSDTDGDNGNDQCVVKIDYVTGC